MVQVTWTSYRGPLSGDVKGDLNLSTRTYSCGTCSLVIDRDLNAAINLARRQPKEPTLKKRVEPPNALLLATA